MSEQIIESFVYVRNEDAQHNQKVLRERPLLIGTLLLIIGITLLILTIKTLGNIFTVSGLIVIGLARYSIPSIKVKNQGKIVQKLTISRSEIRIGDSTIKYDDVTFVEIVLRSRKNRIAYNYHQVWKASGTDNEIIINQNNKTHKFNFVIEKDYQYVEIMKLSYPDNVTVKDLVGLPY